MEMVSRLFVRLHTFMGEKMIWREGIYFLKGGQQRNQDELKGLLQVNMIEKQVIFEHSRQI